MSSDGSSDSSSSSDSPSSRSDSSSDSNSSESSFSNYSTRKFEISKAKSTSLSKWIVTGINDDKIKKCREMYKPTLKRKANILINPSLDESVFLRLRTFKGSHATKANIDPTEKTLRKLSFKILDLVKPLLFLAGRRKLKRKSKSDSIAIKIALRLWATLLRDVIKTRRHNILSQVYPEFTGLLERTDIWSGGEDLFGRKFLKHLVGEARSQATLEGISKRSEKAGSENSQQAPSTSREKNADSFFNSRSRNGQVPDEADSGPSNSWADHAPVSRTGRVSDYTGFGDGRSPHAPPGKEFVDIPVGGMSSSDNQSFDSQLWQIESERFLAVIRSGILRLYLLDAQLRRGQKSLRLLSEEQLETECGITNSIHRQRIFDAIRCENGIYDYLDNKPLDAFISYRRSTGAQWDSLLKVHLQLRNFTVFIDVERLEASKFDNNLLQSISQAKYFLLVLTPNALDRCLGDDERKDWVHREIVAALESN
nr:putative LTR retrotransposon isoform B [Daphnia magna]